MSSTPPCHLVVTSNPTGPRGACKLYRGQGCLHWIVKRPCTKSLIEEFFGVPYNSVFLCQRAGEKTMKAAVVHSFTSPLSLEDIPKPEPEPGKIVVRIEASGLCHTDIHAAHGDWPVKPNLPLIPGHEGVGIVEALGPGADDELKEGDRVAIPWLGFACGHCRYCNTGWETLCESQSNTGYFMDGAYAQYTAGFARHVVKVPEGVDPFEAAPLTCAGVTTYK